MNQDRIEAEINYRIAKWLITNLAAKGYITKYEEKECIAALLELADPPTRVLESVVNPDE